MVVSDWRNTDIRGEAHCGCLRDLCVSVLD